MSQSDVVPLYILYKVDKIRTQFFIRKGIITTASAQYNHNVLDNKEITDSFKDCDKRSWHTKPS